MLTDENSLTDQLRVCINGLLQLGDDCSQVDVASNERALRRLKRDLLKFKREELSTFTLLLEKINNKLKITKKTKHEKSKINGHFPAGISMGSESNRKELF